ncbi:MAG: TolC family protein, partial [Candidatus Omnitrophica bacterium]|nr:TolC family protein [Candidatus Omnitrophota bacterium]
RLDYLPDFMLGYDYIRVDNRPLAMVDNGKDASSVMVSMNVPLWLQKQNGRLSESKSDQIASEAESIQIEKNLLSKIKMTIFKLKDAQRQIQLYRDALVPKAEQSLKASETAYSSGSVEFLNLIDSERSLLNFQLAYYRSIRDYEQRFAELEMIVGQPLRGSHDE